MNIHHIFRIKRNWGLFVFQHQNEAVFASSAVPSVPALKFDAYTFLQILILTFSAGDYICYQLQVLLLF